MQPVFNFLRSFKNLLKGLETCYHWVPDSDPDFIRASSTWGAVRMWSTESFRKKFFRHQNPGGSESRGVRIKILMVNSVHHTTQNIKTKEKVTRKTQKTNKHKTIQNFTQHYTITLAAKYHCLK